MAVIKKPIRKILFYLSSFAGLVFVLIIGPLLKNSQYNLSQLETKAKNLFVASLISSVKADAPGSSGSSSDSGDDAGCGGSGGCGSGEDGSSSDGSDGGSSDDG